MTIQRWQCPIKGTTTTLPNLCELRRDFAKRLAQKPHIKPDGPEDIQTVDACLTCTATLTPIDPLPSTPAAGRPSSTGPAAGQPSAPPAPTAARRDRPGRRAGEGPLPKQAALAQPKPPESEPEGPPPRSDSGPRCHICGAVLPKFRHSLEARFFLWDGARKAYGEGAYRPLCDSPDCHQQARELLREVSDAALDALGPRLDGAPNA